MWFNPPTVVSNICGLCGEREAVVGDDYEKSFHEFHLNHKCLEEADNGDDIT